MFMRKWFAHLSSVSNLDGVVSLQRISVISHQGLADVDQFQGKVCVLSLCGLSLGSFQ